VRREDAERLSDSLRDPQLEPSDHCWTILQDHGPRDGGWGPAGIVIPWISDEPRVWVYTGDMPHVIEWAKGACRELTQATGKPTKLVRYTSREDVFTVGGAS
jgi:hypothetical protein